jgi:NADH-quinone oxidoreductase subunit A
MESFFPIGILFILAVIVCLVLYAAAYLVGPRHPDVTASRLSTYECGVKPEGGAHSPFKNHYYLVAVLFLLFDVEAAFFFPWALIYRESLHDGPGILLAGVVYLGLMVLGLVYIFKKDCLRLNG